jgi:hypothetical protein
LGCVLDGPGRDGDAVGIALGGQRGVAGLNVDMVVSGCARRLEGMLVSVLMKRILLLLVCSNNSRLLTCGLKSRRLNFLVFSRYNRLLTSGKSRRLKLMVCSKYDRLLTSGFSSTLEVAGILKLQSPLDKRKVSTLEELLVFLYGNEVGSCASVIC